MFKKFLSTFSILIIKKVSPKIRKIYKSFGPAKKMLIFINIEKNENIFEHYVCVI